MTHSITAFDRKYLAPDLSKLHAAEAKRKQNRRIAYIVLGTIALTVFHYFILPEMLHSIAPDIF